MTCAQNKTSIAAAAAKALPSARKTPQREAIRAAFTFDGRPLGIDEVLQRARQKVASLNPATIYRNVNMLVREGWLVQINHPEAGTLYERAGKDHHHHFYCRACTRVFELPGCPLAKTGIGPAGFITEGHELFLHGLCKECVDCG